MNMKRIRTFLCIVLISTFYMSFVNGSEKKIDTTAYLYKVGARQVKILKNSEENIAELNYPVIIKNNRSLCSFSSSPSVSILPGNIAVDYDVIAKSIIIRIRDEQGNKLVFFVESNEAYFNDVKIIMDVTPLQIKEKGGSYTLIPIRYTYEPFGYTVEWNNETREITASK